VEIPAAAIELFVDGNLASLRCSGWEQSPAYSNPGVQVLNLCAVEGDVTPIVRAVEEGRLKCYVLANHNLDAEKVQQLRALEPDERVAVLQDKGTKMAPKFVTDRVYAVYAVGEGVRGMVAPAQSVAKKGRGQ